MDELIRETKSVCPACLRVVDARIVEAGDGIYMEKHCIAHGKYRTLIWEDTRENYERWLEYGGLRMAGREYGDCPHACGLCGLHQNAPCSAALMVTGRCDMDCAVCFTQAGESGQYEPSLRELTGLLEYYREAAGEGSPLEFCGGEPTVRGDLPELAAIARDMGFDYIQLNTNGLRIGSDPGYARALKDNGITTVYLGFDGVSPGPYLYKYGRDMRGPKYRALESCRDAGLAVVLVPCVIRGVNDGEVGGIIGVAKQWMPTVRGVYFQPVSYFGKYPKGGQRRITIPALLREIERQTGGEVPRDSFLPAACEHPQCSFGGYFMRDSQGRLRQLTRFHKRTPEVNAVERVRHMTKKTWGPGNGMQLAIGGMAFQDAWNLDLERLQRCTICIIGRDKRLIPLCAKYLTGGENQRLYGGIS